MSLIMRCFDILPLLCLTLFLIRNTRALGIQFVTPAGGATWPAGPITVTWQDAGGNPDMSELVSYTMQLVVGGNIAANSQILQTIGQANDSVATGKTSDTIPADIAQSVENGFYLMMTSNTTTGNQVINYSDRFTLISLNGTTESKYLDGANSAVGVTNVPEAQYNIINQSAAPSIPTSTVTSSSIATATTTASTTPTSRPEHGSENNLIVGLAIGLFVAIVLIAGIAVWTLFRWRRKKRLLARGKELDDDSDHRGSTVELRNASVSSMPAELSPTEQRHEVDGYDKAVEADVSRDVVYELEGDWAGWEASSGRRSKAWDPTQ